MMGTVELARRGVSRGWLWLRHEVLARRFVRNVGVLTIANIVSAVLMLIQAIVVARWLGPELFGVAALLMAYPGFIYTFFDARSSEASVKYLSEFHARGERDRVLAVCKLGYLVDFGIASLAFFVVLATAPWAAEYIAHRPEAVGLIVVYAAAFVLRALTGTSHAVLASLGKFSVIAKMELATSCVRVGLVIGLVLVGYQVAGVIWGNALAMGVTGLLYGGIAFALVQETWGMSWLKGNWHALKGRRREVFCFLAYTDLNALLGMIPKQLDIVILGYFRGPTEAGYYRLARSLAGVVGYLVGPLQSVTYPELARLWGLGNREALRQKVRQLALHVGAPLGLIALGSILLVPFLLPLLVGPSYIPAVIAAQFLLVGSAIWLGFFWLRPLYFAKGELKTWTGISVVVVLFTLVGFVTIVPFKGYLGLAAWLMLMHVLGQGIAFICLRREKLQCN